MRKMIIVIISSILVVILVSYLFNRCSHAVVEDLYNDVTEMEIAIKEATVKEATIGETTTVDIDRGFTSEEREIINEARRIYPLYEKYIEKYGYEVYNKYMEDPKPVMYELCKKNGDWSIFPISDRTYEKYNEKDGLLGNIEYDSIELVNWIPIDEYIKIHGTTYSADQANEPAEVLVTQGKKKTKYYIKYMAFNSLIKDIEVYTYYDSFITDENGNELEVGGPVTDLKVLKLLVDKYDTKVGLSKKFKDEHPNFNGLINVKQEIWEYDINEMGYNIQASESKSDFDNGIGIFKVSPVKRGWSHEYRVDFKLDERGFLDEAKVTLLD